MKLTDLRGILRYIPQFREKTFIISVDGAIVTNENFANLLVDIAVLRSLNIRIVLAHGASAQIKALAATEGVTPSNLDGTGVTDEATLRLALTAANRLTHEILEGLAANDLRAACTNALIAHPVGILHGVDHLFTGKVERVDVEMLQKLLDNGIIPVLPPLGFDGEGRTYRVNSDGVALAAAEALKAAKLMFITPFDGITVGDRVIRQMPVSDLESVLALQSERSPSRPALQGHPCRRRLQGRRAARPCHQRLCGGGPAGGGLYQRRRGHADLRQRIPADPPRPQEGHPQHPQSHQGLGRQRGIGQTHPLDHRETTGRLLHVRDRQKPGRLRRLAPLSRTRQRRTRLPLCQRGSRKPGHRPQAHSIRREQGPRDGPHRTHFALSTQAFTYFQSKAGFVEGTPEDLPPARREKIRAKRPQLEGAHQEARNRAACLTGSMARMTGLEGLFARV